jgi:hypothetical protein
MQKISTFPPHIKIENNISCLRQFNNFMKSFHLHLIIVVFVMKNFHTRINNMQYIRFKYNINKHEKKLKFNPKHHVSNDYDMIP